MKATHTYRTLWVLPLLLSLWSCNATKYLEEGNHLLVRNVVNVDNPDVDKEELNSIVKQQPNRSLFGFWRPYLHVYNYGNRHKENSFNRWLKNTVGEEPVILNSVLTQKSATQLEIYMRNKGYFQASVTDSVVYHSRNPRKARVVYSIKAGPAYTIRQLGFSAVDSTFVPQVLEAARKTQLKFGDNFDVDKFDSDRNIFSNHLKNQGYFYFNKQYLNYEVDTALANQPHKVSVNVVVRNPTRLETLPNGKDTIVTDQHEKYYINNVYIQTDYNQKNLGLRVKDQEPIFGVTLETDTFDVNGYSFIYSNTPRFRPEVLLKAVYLREGELYRLDNHQLTSLRLAELRTFKFISIRYEKVAENQLDCIIRLTPSPRQAITLEAEGTNQQGNLGIAGNVIYLNKNTFKGAESLEFRVKGGLEAQQIANDDEPSPEDNGNTDEGTVEKTVEEFTPFNTIEIGTELKLVIPELLVVKKHLNKLNYTKPRTEVNLAYNFQNRPTFSRTIAEVNYGWLLKPGSFHTISFYPVDISLIQISADADFRALLDALNNSQLSNSYNDHFIHAGRLQYTFNNYNPNKARSHSWYVRPRLELAGILLYQAFRLAGAERKSGSYRIDNIQFANYYKVDVEVIRKISFTRSTQFVYRTFAGLGKPIDNLDVLPFEKSYFGGGANFMRAWRARSLGPGSLPDTLRTGIDKIGEVQLEGNVEYRFDIIEMLKGAAFVDIGNIWNLNNDDDRPGTQLRTDRFLNELAIGTGLGVRLDFSFFILRIDGAIQMKDPSFPKGERWVFQGKDQLNAMRTERGFTKYKFPQGSINLGIGYPF